jgi:hypothetical protein
VFRDRVVGSLVVAGLVMGGAGVAQAKVTTGPGGAVHGCVGAGGVLRVINFKGSCPKAQQSLHLGGQSQQTEIKRLKAQVMALQRFWPG